MRVRACAKVRDQCFWPSSARLCLVKFHRARLSALHRVPACSCAMLRRIGTISVGFPQSNSIALCAFICARSNSFMFSRNDAWLLKYWIPHLNLEKNDVFLITRKLAKKRTGLINSNTKTWSAQKFKHENLKRTERFNSKDNVQTGTAETPPGYAIGTLVLGRTGAPSPVPQWLSKPMGSSPAEVKAD